MRFWAFHVLLLSCCGYALLRGGRDERLCSCVFLLGYLGTVWVHGFAADYRTIVWAVLLIDSVMLAALLAIALKSDRFYPLWLTAMQLIEVLSHLDPLLIPFLNSWAYRVAVAFWSYPMLIALGVATLRTDLRRSKTRAMRFWPNSWLLRLIAIRERTRGRLPGSWFANSDR